jgi:uroporphyrinogen III methyltransferase/synthase
LTGSPLSNKRILITRTEKQSGSFQRLLEESGATVLQVPTIEIVPLDPAPLDRALEEIAVYHWLFFTSANAVDLFFQRYHAVGRGKLLPRICSIGPATSDRVREMGAEVFLQPSLFQAEGILEEFGSLYAGDLSGLKILLPRARVARQILPDQLEAGGAAVDLIPVYDTRIPEESRLRLSQILSKEPPDLVTFTSSSTVRHFAELLSDLPEVLQDDLDCAVIGPITAETAREEGFRVVCMPANSTVPDLVREIESYFLSKAGSGLEKR